MAMGKSNYDKLGASASKAGLHKALDLAGAEHQASHFAQLTPDIAGDADYSSFLHCDGAGTKSVTAYIAAQESGDPKWYRGLAQDALVMNLDDVICLGKPEGLVVANLLNRNAQLVGDEVIAEIISSYIELQKNLSNYDVNFTLGGGETADCGDVTRTLAVDAVIAGRIAHSNLLSTDNIKPGQVIVGLSGAGKASWENIENSGIGSNGLTLARHTLLKKEYCEKYPEVVDPNTDSSVVYTGPFAVDDNPNGLGMTVGEALLSPTRTFAPVLIKIFESEFDKISACIHVSGGALSKVIRFGKGNIYVKDQLLPIPAIFNLIQETGNIPWKEMYQVFNMGQRMEVYCEQSAADSIIKTSESMGVEAGIIGRVEKNPDSDSQNIVKVDSPNGSFEYQL